MRVESANMMTLFNVQLQDLIYVAAVILGAAAFGEKDADMPVFFLTRVPALY